MLRRMEAEQEAFGQEYGVATSDMAEFSGRSTGDMLLEMPAQEQRQPSGRSPGPTANPKTVTAHLQVHSDQ